MKIIQRSKKILTLSLSVIVLASLFLIGGGSIKANATELPVQLYSSNYTYEAFGGGSFYTGTIYVKVSNNGIYSSSSKNVTVHALSNTYPYGSAWRDYSCQYVGNLNDGYQLWKCNVTSSFDCNVTYAIKYEVNGQTYWDNNSQNNYTQNNTMGSAIVKAHTYVNDTGYNSSNNYSNNISATVKNLGNNKIVKVRYTEDNWATWKEKNLSYVKSNVDNSEEWGCYIEPSDYSNIDKFHYAVSYQVNGQTYWDNNCGNNFNYSY